MARDSADQRVLAHPSVEARRSRVLLVEMSSVDEHASERCNRRGASGAICLTLLVASFAFFGTGYGKEAHAGAQSMDDEVDVPWGPAPDWPFEGIVTHKGGELGYLPWTVPSYVSRHGLQFMDVQNESLIYVELMDEFDVGHFACATTSMGWSDAGLIWTLLSGSAYPRRWYVPWGDYAYSLFSSDLSHYSIGSPLDTPSGEMTTVGSGEMLGVFDARFTVWSRIADEPACAPYRHDLAVRLSDESLACGFSWSPIFLIASTATATDDLDWTPVSPYRATDYESCGTLDLEKWREAVTNAGDL